MRRERGGWVAPLIGVVLAIGALGHCAYVYSTCDGKVVRGFFDQPVCLEGK